MKNRYRVSVPLYGHVSVVVEAESDDDAELKVRAMSVKQILWDISAANLVDALEADNSGINVELLGGVK